MFYIYIIQSVKDHRCYIGSTNDLRDRFAKHNEGHIFSTKFRRPLKFVYYEAYRAESDARKRESNLKLRSRAYTQLKKRIKDSLVWG